MKKIKHRFQHLPIAYTGLSLGIGGLGNCFLNILQFNNNLDFRWITCISISFVIAFLLLIFFRNLLHPKILKYELKEPLLVSLTPTFSMSLMLVAGFIAMWDKNKISFCQIFATILLAIAVFWQFLAIGYFLISFIRHHIKNNQQNMYGTYFVPVVGLITCCTVQGNFTLVPNIFFQVIWYIGWIFFIFSLPFFTYSLLFKEKKVDQSQFPTIAVWFAPANLSCAGFVQVFLNSQQANYYSIYYLYTILFLTVMVGFTTTLLLYLYVFRIFIINWKNKIKFSPIMCSLSFPLAIGATAMIFTAKHFLIIQFTFGAQFFFIFACIFASVALIVILYLLLNMILLAFNILLTKKHDTKQHHVYK